MNTNQTGHSVNRERGSALFISLLVMVVLSILGLTMVGMALTENTVASNWLNQTKAFYAAEAGIESALAALKPLLQAGTPPTNSQLDGLSTTALPTLSDANLSFKKLEVKRIRPTPYKTVLDSGPFKSMFADATDYQITAEVTGPRGSRVKLNHVIQYIEVPLFQFLAFYGKGVDFESYPGPVMTLKGRIHANSSIYLVDSGADGFHFESAITAAGNFNRLRKNDQSNRAFLNGNPDIKDASGTPRFLDFDHQVKNIIGGNPATWVASDENYWRQEALNRFGGMILDSAHGVPELIPPIADLFYNPSNPDVVSHQMIEKGAAGDSAALKAAKLYYQADLRIINGAATRKDGSSVSLPAGVISTKSFYDAREKKTMTVTEVDVSVFKANLSTIMPAGFNGILYVSNDAADTGVRLVKGSQLPTQGLTVVSENPMYIAGDYNTVSKVPAAVLADAVTVLSNNWVANGYDGKGDWQFENRPASETTVNAALALGPNRESTAGSPGYSNGQFNNLVRFLENWGPNWTSVNFNYNGSFIAIWHSQRAQADFWCCDGRAINSTKDYFSPPNRIWAYDTLFNTNPPPGVPKGVIIVRGRWWQE